MENILAKTYDNSFQRYTQNWFVELQKNMHLQNAYRNPTLSLYTSMVFGFANHLPYSMDIEQPEYVPADFLNMVPNDVEENSWFKWEDRRTFFNAMVHAGDPYKSGMLLQMCCVFQKMILGQFPTDYVLTEDDFIRWKIAEMTENQEYNRLFFEVLQELPAWYHRLLSSVNNAERREVLEMLYWYMMNRIATRGGSFKETDLDGKIIRESKGAVPITPSNDVVMLVRYENVTFHDGITAVIEAIKNEQLEEYNKNKAKRLGELSEGDQSPMII